MIARALSKLCPAPIALCQHDLWYNQADHNRPDRLMITDTTRAAQELDQTHRAHRLQREAYTRAELDVASQNLALTPHLFRSHFERLASLSGKANRKAIQRDHTFSQVSWRHPYA